MRLKVTITIIGLTILTGIGVAVLFITTGGQTDINKEHAAAVTTTLWQAGPGNGAAPVPVPSDETAKTDSGDGREGLSTTGGTPPPSAPPDDVSRLNKLNSFVTAQAAGNGKSIELLFFLEGPGYFTIQEKKSGQWLMMDENVYYAGTGSLPAGEIAPDESVKTIRALKIEIGRASCRERV